MAWLAHLLIGKIVAGHEPCQLFLGLSSDHHHLGTEWEQTLGFVEPAHASPTRTLTKPECAKQRWLFRCGSIY